MSIRKNITNVQFGKLIALSYFDSKHGKTRWVCKCECGNKSIHYSSHLLAGLSRSCGCLKREKTIQRNKLRKLKGIDDQAFGRCYSRYKYGANKRKIDFDLNKAEFKELTKQNCYYCGIKPLQSEKTRNYGNNYIYNGIDRKDNNLGYSKDNCLPCCKICNSAKNSMAFDDFINWINRIVKKNTSRE